MALWWNNVPISTSPVFFYPPAVDNFGKSTPLASAIVLYREIYCFLFLSLLLLLTSSSLVSISP